MQVSCAIFDVTRLVGDALGEVKKRIYVIRNVSYCWIYLCEPSS